MTRINPGEFVPEPIKDFYTGFSQGEWRRYPAIWQIAIRLVTDPRMERVYRLVEKKNPTDEEWRNFFDLAVVSADIDFSMMRDEASEVASRVRALAKPLGKVVELLKDIEALPHYQLIPREVDSLHFLLKRVCSEHSLLRDIEKLSNRNETCWPSIASMLEIMQQASEEYRYSSESIEYFPGAWSRKHHVFASYIRQYYMSYQSYFGWSISLPVLFDLAAVATGETPIKNKNVEDEEEPYFTLEDKAAYVRSLICKFIP